MDTPPSRPTLFPAPQAPAPPPAHHRPASTPPLRLFPPLTGDRAPALGPSAGVAGSPGLHRAASQLSASPPLPRHQLAQLQPVPPGGTGEGESVRLAAEALNRMCLASPRRGTSAASSPAMSPLALALSPRAPPSGPGAGASAGASAGVCTTVGAGTTPLEQAKGAVVQAMMSLSVRDTGPFLAFLDDIVSNKYAHVLQQYRNTLAVPRPLFQQTQQAQQQQQAAQPQGLQQQQGPGGFSFVVFPRVPSAPAPRTFPASAPAPRVVAGVRPRTAMERTDAMPDAVAMVAPQPGHAPAVRAQTPPARTPAAPPPVLMPSARSAFTQGTGTGTGTGTGAARSSSPAGGSTPRQALQISSLVS